MNLTLGSVVPLAMFSLSVGEWQCPFSTKHWVVAVILIISYGSLTLPWCSHYFHSYILGHLTHLNGLAHHPLTHFTHLLLKAF